MGHENQQISGHSHHISGYKEHFMTLGVLLVLTVLTVAVSVYGAELGSFSVIMALLIATIKALVVAAYFMHLKYDLKIYRWMVLIVMFMFVVFMVILSIDYANR